MKKITASVFNILCLSMCAFFMGCAPEPVKESMALRMYNTDVAQAELLYLSKLDPSTLTPEQLLEKTTREADITKLNNDMVQSGVPFASIRVPPGPTPCPLPFGCQDYGVDIGQFELGFLYMDPDSLTGNVARKSATQEPSATIQLDALHVFAVGKLKVPVDPIFKTARFAFVVVDSSLGGKNMVMTITTTILKDGKQHAVEMNIPVPADTFSAD
jgi:hypothetical protein